MEQVHVRPTHETAAYNRANHIKALLAYILTTEQLDANYRTYADLTIGGVQLGSRHLMTDASRFEVRQARTLINQTLAELEGINHYFDDAATGQRIPCTLTSWHGSDPSESNRHLWGTVQFPGQVISLEVTALQEIRLSLEQ